MAYTQFTPGDALHGETLPYMYHWTGVDYMRGNKMDGFVDRNTVTRNYTGEVGKYTGGNVYRGGIVEPSLAQHAYHTWIASLYGSTDEAFTKGVKTWEQLPDKAQTAWETTVTFVEVYTARKDWKPRVHENEGCGEDAIKGE